MQRLMYNPIVKHFVSEYTRAGVVSAIDKTLDYTLLRIAVHLYNLEKTKKEEENGVH